MCTFLPSSFFSPSRPNASYSPSSQLRPDALYPLIHPALPAQPCPVQPCPVSSQPSRVSTVCGWSLFSKNLDEWLCVALPVSSSKVFIACCGSFLYLGAGDHFSNTWPLDYQVCVFIYHLFSYFLFFASLVFSSLRALIFFHFPNYGTCSFISQIYE